MIIGLTDNVRPAFPNIGTLRKGAPRKEGDNRPGADLKTFRFTSDRPEVQVAFEAAYGSAEPAVLHCYLPQPGIEDNWEAWCEEWGKSGLLHRCDGEMMMRWRTPDGEISNDPRPCPYHTDEKKRTKDQPGCKPVGRLSVILPEMVQAGYVGYVTLLTGAKNDILSITACLQEASARRNGHPKGLQGILWVLRRQLVQISTPTPDGKRVRRGKWLIRIEPAAEWVQYELATARAEALGQLPATTATAQQVDTTTGEIIARPNGDDDEDVIGGEVEPTPVTETPAAPEPKPKPVWPPSEQNRYAAGLRKRTLGQREAADLLGLPAGAVKADLWELGSVDEVFAGIDAAIERQAEAEQVTHQAPLPDPDGRPF